MADDRTMVAYRPGAEMLGRLKAAADSNHRSVAAEVAFRVEQSFTTDQRTIIREELHAVLGELETARVRRSAALEELAQNDAACWASQWTDAEVAVIKAHGPIIGGPAFNKIRA